MGQHTTLKPLQQFVGLKLHGGWIVRSAWLFVTLFGVSILVLALPELWRTLTTVCAAEPCKQGQPTAAGMAVLARLGLPLTFYSTMTLAAHVLVPAVITAVMGIVVWRKPQDVVVISLAFAGVTCSMIGAVTEMAGRYTWLVLPLHSFWFMAGAGFALGLFSFPDGRFIPPWSRYLAYALIVASALALVPGLDQLGGTGESLAMVGFALTFPLALAFLLFRYVRSDSIRQKQQIKWVVFSIGVMVAVLLVNMSLGWLLPQGWLEPGAPGNLFSIILGSSSIIFFWLCIAVSVYRYQLFDIDLIIKRTLIYGGLTLSIVLIYLASIAAAGALTLDNNLWVSLLATGAVALSFQPLRERLQRSVNRLLYGYRDEPYQVIARLGRRLEATIDPASILPATVETVAEVLKLPYVAIALTKHGEVQRLAEYGQVQTQEETFSLMYGGEVLGELIVSPRVSEEMLSSADRWLLSDLARQVGIAAHALLLQVDLECSRLRIVTAREEARRQLGNDLHDTVGHQFVGLTRRAETVSNLLEQHPEEARQLLQELVKQGRAAAEHVRALAHQLHPPELEVLGLVGVIREWAEADGGDLQVRLELPDALPKLPAAVEVAAYCIVREALQNIHKHASARHCHVRLTLARGTPLATSVLTALDTPVLEIDVVDDGRGFTDLPKRGLGLCSVQERATEVGGICRIDSEPGHGTRLSVRLPCPEEL